MNLSRRNLLVAASGALAGLGGCVDSSANPKGVVIGQLWLENWSSEPKSITYEVERDQQIVLANTLTIEPHETDENNRVIQGQRLVPTTPMHERDVYTIRYRLAGEDDWHGSLTFDGSRYSCVGIIIKIMDGGISPLIGETPDKFCLTSPSE